MKKALIAFGLLAAPFAAYAQTGGLGNIISIVGNLINSLLPIIVGLAVLGFFWGLAMYVFKSGDEEAKEKGRNIMIWGIVAIFVMVSVWGIVRILQDTFGLEGSSPVNVPTVPTTR